MSKIVFKYVSDDGDTIVVTTSSIVLEDVRNTFYRFLAGIGYQVQSTEVLNDE